MSGGSPDWPSQRPSSRIRTQRSAHGRRARGGAPWRPALALPAALGVLAACAPTPVPTSPEVHWQERLQSLTVAALDLYDSGEYVLAARRFRDVQHVAIRLADRVTERRATTGECVSWLRVRRLTELAECAERLERLQRREPRPDPGVNTLIALGSIAGGRPLPPLKIPNAVAPVIRESARSAPPDEESP